MPPKPKSKKSKSLEQRDAYEEWLKEYYKLSKEKQEIIKNAVLATYAAARINPRQANYTNTLKTSSQKGGKKKRKTQKRRK